MTSAVALATGLGLPCGAQASSRQLTIMQDDGLLLKLSDETRQATLDEFAALGADVVKVQVYWNEMAPAGKKKPAGFDASNPAAYDWSAYDAVVRGTVARGMRPYLVLGNRAPDWARKKRTSHNGNYRPSAKELRLFSIAAGTRYSGSYGGLPRVDIWSIWNEPNLVSWLAPQRSKSGIPLSPSIYRNLYMAGHRALESTGHGSDTVLLGELMPLGQTSRTKVPPLQFLREMACLDRRYRPYHGRAARALDCPKRVGRIPTSGIAYHPYTPPGGPSALPQSNEASISTLGRITGVTDRIAARGRMSRHVPVWVSEYGFQTNPPDVFQYPIKRVPGYMDESEWFAFRNSRVASYSQYTLRDDKLNSARGPSRYGGFQLGLRFSNGRRKPGVYSAFRLPAFVRLLSGDRVEVFGGLRTATRGTQAVISSRRGKGRYRVLRRTKVNVAGYFRTVVHASDASGRTYKITIGGTSRIKHAARR